MGRVVVVGSYNVGMSIFSPTLPRPGQTVLGHVFDMGPGGKGSNQAIGARRLGAEVTFVVKLGTDVFATSARELFAREGLLGPGILQADTHTGVAAILVDDEGRNMISVAPGANAQLSEADLDAIPGLFDDASHLLCQLECPPELFVGAAERARALGLVTILNPAPATPLPEDVLALVDLLTPNESELSLLTGMATDDGPQVERAARALLERGVGQVIATLGERGALWVTEEEVRRFPSYPVGARDTTGAGDAFNAGLVSTLALGGSIADAIDLGSRAGAFCATQMGVIAGLPTQADLQAFVRA